MLLARRNLLQDTTRLALSISGVALAVMLILLLQGFLGGMYRQIAAYLDPIGISFFQPVAPAEI